MVPPIEPMALGVALDVPNKVFACVGCESHLENIAVYSSMNTWTEL